MNGAGLAGRKTASKPIAAQTSNSPIKSRRCKTDHCPNIFIKGEHRPERSVACPQSTTTPLPEAPPQNILAMFDTIQEFNS
jgi:hypothetical protein